MGVLCPGCAEAGVCGGMSACCRVALGGSTCLWCAQALISPQGLARGAGGVWVSGRTVWREGARRREGVAWGHEGMGHELSRREEGGGWVATAGSDSRPSLISDPTVQ